MIRYRARYVLPVSAPPIIDGIVAVEGDRISWVGSASHAPAGEERDLGNAILLPGLVNAHCHLELTAMRGFLEDLDFRSWILRLTTAKRSVLSRDMLLDSARLGIVEGLARGITTYADTCDSGVAFDAMCEVGVRGIMYQEVFGPDPAQCAASLAELQSKIQRLRPLETALVRVGVSPHAAYTVSDALFSAVGDYALAAELPIAVHIAESSVEQALIVDGGGAFAEGLRARGIPTAPRARSPIALLSSLGVLRARPLLIHCVRVDDSDIAAIAESRCAVAHCPTSNAKLGHGIAPLTSLLASRVRVGLGSDSVASNNRMDILEEARLALLFQRARTGAHAVIPPAVALSLATIDGARALGLDREIGSLEVGKSADLAAFPLGNIGPVHDPEAHAVLALPGTMASLVTVAGSELVADSKTLTVDSTLVDRVQRSADALGEWLRSQAGRNVP